MEILDMIGTIAFAISGSMVAIEKKVDVFGVCLLGLITAVGGGMFRDLILGQTPPRIFQSKTTLLVALIVSILVFLIAYFNREVYQKSTVKVDKINNVFDALGLGVFTVTGMQVAMDQQITDEVLIVFCGCLTGIGGGLLRDLMVNEIPFILRKYVYAVASIVGGICYWGMLTMNLSKNIAMVTSIMVVFAIRICATVFRWNLPKAA